MHPASAMKNQNTHSLWLGFLMHSVVIFTAAPMLYWVLMCLRNLPFHFGMLVEASFGIPASYKLCGLPLLSAAAISAGLGFWLSKLCSIWYRLGLGAVTGCMLGLALESYLLWKVRGSQGYQTFSIPCSFEGAFLGLCFSSLSRFCYRGARTICGRIAEPGAEPNCGPATSVGNSGVVNGPQSVT
jgi:hypothetical protein